MFGLFRIIAIIAVFCLPARSQTYIGSWKIDDVVIFTANTHDPATAACADADAAPTYRIYENEVGTAIATGTMALIDSGNTCGFYSESITLSAGTGYEKGKNYTVFISGVVDTIEGTTSRIFQVQAEVDSPKLGTPTVDISTDIRRSSGAVVTDTPIASLSSQTVFVLTDGPPDNGDIPSGSQVIITDVSNALQRDVVVACGYVGSTETLTLCQAPSFTIATTDRITVLPGTAGATILQRGVAFTNYPILMRLASNPTLGATGQTVSCTRSIAGGASAATASVSEATYGNGWYVISSLSATELGGEYMLLTCTGTGGSGASQTYSQIIFTQQ
jgi:hypothetical protein